MSFSDRLRHVMIISPCFHLTINNSMAGRKSIMYKNIFSLSITSVIGHLGWFYSLTLVNRSVINIFSKDLSVLNSLDKQAHRSARPGQYGSSSFSVLRTLVLVSIVAGLAISTSRLSVLLSTSSPEHLLSSLQLKFLL